MQRRRFLKTIITSLLLAITGFRSRTANANLPGVFRHGVASGDPTSSGVVLWTRVTTEGQDPVTVRWAVAQDAQMSDVVAHGTAHTDASRDFTVKLDVLNLPQDSWLYYRFWQGDERSMLGRTRTLPAGIAQTAKFAVVTCSNHPAGYFHAYREIANRMDLDAVMHLGDYIYEYGPGGYATENAANIDREPDPPHEVQTLADYRTRYAQYRSDPDLQAMHAALPMIATWDDHEIANDSWRDGAANHQDEEGDWAARLDAAVRAWFEWMPVRGEPDGGATRIYRDFRWGDLATIIMLDTRMIGRDMRPDRGSEVTAESVDAALEDPGRRMLGSEQEHWLRQRLAAAQDSTWQIIGQQVKAVELRSPDLEPLVARDGSSRLAAERLDAIIQSSKDEKPVMFDTWDGYPPAREEFLEDLADLGRNPVVLSGDMHNSLGADLVPAGAEKTVAVEFMTPAVSSPTMSDNLPDLKPNGVRDATLALNPWIRYLDIDNHGWLCLSLTKQECTGEWRFVEDILEREYTTWLDHTLSVRANRIRDGLY